jgi:hypothetical protein
VAAAERATGALDSAATPIQGHLNASMDAGSNAASIAGREEEDSTKGIAQVERKHNLYLSSEEGCKYYSVLNHLPVKIRSLQKKNNHTGL